MHKFCNRLSWCLLSAVLLVVCGCSATERQAAKRIDFTSEIIQQAGNLFASDPELSRMPVVVDGFKNAMHLKGQVQTQTQKTRAEKILWAVRGVRSVQNDIEVRAAAAQATLPAKTNLTSRPGAPPRKAR